MASKPVANALFNPILRRCLQTITPSILRPYPHLPRTLQPAARRFAHSIPKPRGHPTTPAEKQRARKLAQPHYQLTFTCVPCGHRSAHEVSKVGYHHGSVLITCPSCRNRHIISDHLKIFSDRNITVEDLMREKGRLVKRGTLGEHGDIEFWEDNKDFDALDLQSKLDAQGKPDGREARDPSSQTTEPNPMTSALSGNAGARPSTGGSRPKNPTSSTRREYSTVMQPRSFKSRVTSDDFLAISTDRSKYPHRIDELSEMYLRRPNRRMGNVLRAAFDKHRSSLTRVPKEVMLRKVNEVYAKRYGGDANASSQALRALEAVGRSLHDLPPPTKPTDYLWPPKPQSHTRRGFLNVRYHRSYTSRRMNQEGHRDVMKVPSVRRAVVQDRFKGVRLYNFHTVDGRPQYIRTGPGPLHRRRRPIPWTGTVENQDAKAEEAEHIPSEDDPDIPFRWEIPPDVPDWSNRTVYPTTARGWAEPRARSYVPVYKSNWNGDDKIYFYEAIAIRRAERASKRGNQIVSISTPSHILYELSRGSEKDSKMGERPGFT